MRAGSRAALFMATLAMLAVSAQASRLAWAHAQLTLGGGALWESLLQGSAAVAAVAAGIVLVMQRRVIACGLLLALTGPAIALAQLPVPELGSDLLFTAALTCASWAPALVGCAALTCPVSPLLPIDRAIIAATLGTAVVVQGLFSTVVYDPRGAGCFGCSANLAEIHALPEVYVRLGHWGLILTVVWGIVLPARACWRWLVAPRVVRQAYALLLLGGCGVAVLTAFAAVHALLATTQEIDGTLTSVWLCQCGLVVLMAVGVAAEGRRARGLASAMTTDVVTSTLGAEAVATTFAASIGDPNMELLFLRDTGTAIDAGGRDVVSGQRSSAVVRVRRGEVAIAEVWYDPRLVGASYRLLSVVRAAGLAVERLAAYAGLQAELAELAASRLRIVAAGDTERRRMERDLHDGAQQRLIALQVHLQLAAAVAASDVSERYRAARAEIGVALEELRDLAHGIHPAALTDGGLGVGLRTLAETSPVALTVAGHRPRRHPAAAEAAAYRLVADTVHTAGHVAGGSAVTVTLHGDEEVLRARLMVEGLDATIGEGIVSRAIDRVAALDGSLELAHASGIVTIEVVIPCAS